MKKLPACLLLLFACCSFTVFCQRPPGKIKFGDIKPEDFAPAVYSIDSGAKAVVLADIGESRYEGSNDGFLNLVFNHVKRVRLITKAGFDNATVEIVLYHDDRKEESITSLEAVTYNIENGKIIATKVDKASIFKDSYDKHHWVRKFTFPNIKEGSIIEYKYTVKSPFAFDLPSWEFQGEIPRLWSEYSVKIPNDLLDFALLRHGYLPYTVDSLYTTTEQYQIIFPTGTAEADQLATLTSRTINARWAIKNAPPLKDESFVTSLKNYNNRIEFELERIKWSATEVQEYMGDWRHLADQLMKDDDFGVPLTDAGGWLPGEVKKITAGEQGDLAKAKKLFAFIRDNFTCTLQEGIKTAKPLKKVYQDKSGNVAEINLLLTAALRTLGLTADPAILSTRANGKANETYPLITEYNYVITRLNINGAFFKLDASDKMAGFGKLSAQLYNGSARVIGDDPELVPLSPDSLKESRVTAVVIKNDDDGKGQHGTVLTILGNEESITMRQKLAKQKPDDYFKERKKDYPFETDISDVEVDSLNNPDYPLGYRFNFTVKSDGGDVIYFSPVIEGAYRENPFKAAERLYPVEMPWCINETYSFDMEIPKGYKAEEIPKPVKVKLNDVDGGFEYLAAQDNGHIKMRCKLALSRASFDPEDYQGLRELFAAIVKKEAEQIVFKRL